MSSNLNENLLTLDEAIEHCEEVASRESCSPCAQNHRQLGEWLKRLRYYESLFNPSLDTPHANNPFGIDLHIVPESCHECPNHPANGGSGICFCILGQPEIK